MLKSCETGKINPIVNNPFKVISGYIDGRRKFRLEGDLAWALVQLMAAGMAGYMLDGEMAPFSSGEICKFRKMGMEIDTVRSKSADASVCFRMRYVLRSQITITEIELTEKLHYVA